jgi:hypothetical protein
MNRPRRNIATPQATAENARNGIDHQTTVTPASAGILFSPPATEAVATASTSSSAAGAMATNASGSTPAAAAPPPPPPLPALPAAAARIGDIIGSFWDDTKIKRIFNASSECTEAVIHHRIELLHHAINDAGKLADIVNKAADHPLTPNQALQLSHKCTYLRMAYTLALDKMPTGNATWGACCREAVVQMKHMGLTTIVNERSIQNWNVHFKKAEVFPHPNLFVESGKKPTPLLFVHYPRYQKEIEQWCLENLEILSCERLANHIRATILPCVYKEYQKDFVGGAHVESDSDESTHLEEVELSGASFPPPAAIEDMLEYKDFLYINFRIKKFEPSTAHAWMLYIGFKYCEQTNVYYTDRHENDENKQDRGVFSPKHFELERRAHRWIQITAEEAKKLEEEETDNKKKRKLLKHIAHEYTLVEPDHGTVIDMREYHIDAHPTFETYVLAENKKFGGNLSVRKKPHERPVIIIGQDESIYRQFIFSKKGWVGAKGEKVLRPKDEGHGLMLSAFVSRLWSFFDVLSNSVLPDDVRAKVNDRRKNQHYKSMDAAQEINGTTAKPAIKDFSPFLRFFEYGADKEGYWNYSHMALQVEDLVDCLVVLYPDFDFALLFDHSSGHGKSQKDGLNVNLMSKAWGGKQPNMHQSKITVDNLADLDSGRIAKTGQLGPGDTQFMVFQESEMGPFNMPSEEEREQRKYDTVADGKEIKKRTKMEILKEIRNKTGNAMRDFKTVEEVHSLANEHNIPITVKVDKKVEGWVGKPKGLLQILWERGFIDDSNLSKYSMNGSKDWFEDEKKKKLKPEHEADFKKHSLVHLMSECSDFKNERSAMEQLAVDLSSGQDFTVSILSSPKYHCELAGDGIEYDWGLSKKIYRRLPYADKKGKSAFKETLVKCLKQVNVGHRRKFSAKARRYMLTYQLFDSAGADADFAAAGLSYKEIEKHVNKIMKTHRSTYDQEHAYISKIWRESLVE